MSESSLPEESIFAQALEIASAAERAAFLDRTCGDNASLRAEVEALLRANQRSGDLLDLPENAAVTAHLPAHEGPGTIIGPYKLLELIGEGGMGAVWMAEQTEPIRRRVALKVIKEGMDSKQVLARFEAERQALALMEHPNIAKVLDAGKTPSGRPYFVMELVKGQPITKHSDDKRLGVRERLELFGDICRAVQHAHQKGIIHRDIKPSNVLAALYDGKPVVKVIDFGVAKATGQRLTDKTLFTGFGALVGTPEYMSPEQAEVNNQDIDTRSDIYSLGVLLYELLTGSPPFSRKELEKAGMLEMLRVIREQEPSKPSTKLNTAEGLPTLAANRGTEPAKLTRLVRGELDWIVMKALEKDRNRRYETANGFAMDVQRYLADEPVAAGPPSAVYRFRKFARRNKGSLAIAGLILFFIAVFGGGGGWFIRDRHAREEAVAKERRDREAAAERERRDREQRLTARVGLILDDVERLERQQKWPEAQAAAERAEAAIAAGEVDDAIRQRVGDALRDLKFAARLDQIRQDRATTVEGRWNWNNPGAARDYALAFREFGVDVEALPAVEAVARLLAKPALALLCAAALDDWVDAVLRLPKDAPNRKPLIAIARGLDSAEPLRDRLRALVAGGLRALDGSIKPEVQAELRRLAESVNVRTQSPTTIQLLARTLTENELTDVAIQILRDGQYAYPGDFWLSFDLGRLFSEQKKNYAEAARYFSVVVSIRPRSTLAHNVLGATLSEQRNLDEAITEYRRVIELDPKNASAHINLGVALGEQGKRDEEITAYRNAIAIDPDITVAHNNLGNALRELGKLEEAVTECRKAIALDPRFAPPHNNLGLALFEQRKLEEAITEYRVAVALDPKYANPHSNLGGALRAQGKLDQAIVELRKAVELDAKSAKAHNNLGLGLHEQRSLDEAVAEYRKAIALDPTFATAHSNLGGALSQQGGKPDEAIAEFRKAVELDPTLAEAHFNLGQELMRQGKFRPALEALRRSHELGSKKPRWSYRSAEWVRLCERAVQLDEKLPGFLDGTTTPASPAERVELAGFCALKRLNRAAARFYDQAFAAEPKLAEDAKVRHRYHAARAAALAGCGQGNDADRLDQAEKAQWRGRALEWLRADLAAWQKDLAKNTPEAHAAVRDKMQRWQVETDFAGVRGPDALAKLPEAERSAWQKLWHDVADALKRAQAKATPEKKSGTK